MGEYLDINLMFHSKLEIISRLFMIGGNLMDYNAMVKLIIKICKDIGVDKNEGFYG